MQESEYFTQELTLDIYYSSRFVQYPHYPIACCLPHLCTMSHNCHSKKKNLTAQIITSRQNEKDSWQKENLTAKRKRLKAKRKPHSKRKKTHGKIYSIPRGHFNS